MFSCLRIITNLEILMSFINRVVGKMHILAKSCGLCGVLLAGEASKAFVVDVDT